MDETVEQISAFRLETACRLSALCVAQELGASVAQLSIVSTARD